MDLFGNFISLSGKESKDSENIWTSLLKTSENEPTDLLEKSLLKDHKNKENSKYEVLENAVERPKAEEGILEARQTKIHSNDSKTKHVLHEKGFAEDWHDSRFHDVDGIPLYTVDVLEKEKARAKENEDFYKSQDINKKVEVVSAENDKPALVVSSEVVKDFLENNKDIYIVEYIDGDFPMKEEIAGKENAFRFQEELNQRGIESTISNKVESSRLASLMESIYIKKEDPKDSDYNKDHLGYDSSDLEKQMSNQPKPKKKTKKDED